MDKKHIEEIDVDDILACCKRRLAAGPTWGPGKAKTANQALEIATWHEHLRSFIAYIEQYIALRDKNKKQKIN